MGWTVIAYGNWECEEKYKDMVLNKFKEFESEFMSIDYYEFEMQGNKGIDYDCLDKIKQWSIEQGISLEINTSEYSECGTGYYFNSEDKK